MQVKLKVTLDARSFYKHLHWIMLLKARLACFTTEETKAALDLRPCR